MRSPSLLEALQYLALRQARDEHWTRRMIKRAQNRARACAACAAVVQTFRQFMRMG